MQSLNVVRPWDHALTMYAYACVGLSLGIYIRQIPCAHVIAYHMPSAMLAQVATYVSIFKRVINARADFCYVVYSYINWRVQ